MSITLYEAQTPVQLEQVRVLFTEYQSELGIELDFQDFPQELASLPGDYARPAGRLLLASQGVFLAGVVALRPLQGYDCEMKRLYIRPAGRTVGIGRMLVTALIDEARHEGYRRMLLDTLPQMLGAQSLYRSLGFAEIAPYRHNPIVGTLYMALNLAPAPMHA